MEMQDETKEIESPPKDAIAAYEGTNPAKLTGYLFLGDFCAAEKKEQLKDLGITHILNVDDESECLFPDDFSYLHYKIEDGGKDPKIVECFEAATCFVRQALENGDRVLVHCFMGINRSATVAIAVLMNIEGWTLREAYEHVKACRSISPFEGNKAKIALWELKTRNSSTLPAWLPPNDVISTST